MKKNLVIFDFDGTLVDSEIIAAEVFPSVWASMGLEMSKDFFICNFVGTGSDAEIVKTTLSSLPPNAMEVADKVFDDELKKRLRPVEGIQKVLDELPVPSCIASNSSLAYIHEALKVTALDSYFSGRAFSSKDLKKPKPAPDVFLHAATWFNVPPGECVVIEDSVPGIQAAKSAGMEVIGFMGGLHFNSVVEKKLISANANHYCSSSEDLGYILKKMI